ncbi:MAG TPA: sulfite exporter TauE/SafE family protein [Thermoanaerobaculia bacterium]|nr:sulfite exporter TauE/SafE family protein [Thermoanaerobaculia bacterium]
MALSELALLVASGIAAGLIGSLFGLGGGILMVPVLVLALKVPMHNAVATSLLCVIATSSAAAARFVERGVANVRLGMTLELWTVLGAMLGSLVAGLLPGNALVILFASAMTLMAIPMARKEPALRTLPPPELPGNAKPRFQKRLGSRYFDDAEAHEVSYEISRLPLAMGVSGAAGLLSGLLGVGGGILKVPVLTMYCSVPMKAAAATSNFMIGVTALASSVVYYGRGEISPLVTAASVVGVVIGSRAGAQISGKIKGSALRRAFAVLMIVIAAQLFWKALSGEIR